MVTRLETAAAGTSTTGASSTSAQAAAAIMRFGGYNTDKSQEKGGEDLIKEEEGQLSIEIAEKVLKWHAEAIGRCVELSPPGEMYAFFSFSDARPFDSFQSKEHIFTTPCPN